MASQEAQRTPNCMVCVGLALKLISKGERYRKWEIKSKNINFATYISWKPQFLSRYLSNTGQLGWYEKHHNSMRHKWTNHRNEWCIIAMENIGKIIKSLAKGMLPGLGRRTWKKNFWFLCQWIHMGLSEAWKSHYKNWVSSTKWYWVLALWRSSQLKSEFC